jgi:hypothetical protein
MESTPGNTFTGHSYARDYFASDTNVQDSVCNDDFRQLSLRVAHLYRKRGNVGIHLFQRLVLVRTPERSGFLSPQVGELGRRRLRS